MDFVSTTDIISSSERLEGSDEFFGRFPDAWSSARSQVWKFELQQHYNEPDSESWQIAMEGDLKAAIGKIPASRAVDLPLYNDLCKRRVEFARCRPIVFPRSKYIDWELNVYDYNSQHGERIYCFNFETLSIFVSDFLHHDFMIFDSRLAFIHDYSAEGDIMGGWMVSDPDSIKNLLALFSFAKANSQHFSFFLNQ